MTQLIQKGKSRFWAQTMGLSFYCPDGLSYCFGRYSGQRTQYSSLGPRQGTECRLRERYHSRARESRGNNAELVVRLVR